MRRVAILAISTFLFGWRATNATVAEMPPLTKESIVGVWEGLLDCPPMPITVFHLEMSASGDSYLVEIEGSAFLDGRTEGFTVFKLVAADSKVSEGETKTTHFTAGGVSLSMTGTPIDLQFEQVTSGPGLGHFRITGIGAANNYGQGSIQCTNIGSNGIWFEKGSWTQKLGKASEKAADAIKQLAKSK